MEWREKNLDEKSSEGEKVSEKWKKRKECLQAFLNVESIYVLIKN